jgi:hypothetical protein
MVPIFYERVRHGLYRRWWMASAYYDWHLDNEVNVIFPLHYLVMFAWWSNQKWCKYKNKPSWIDKQVAAAIELEKKGVS